MTTKDIPVESAKEIAEKYGYDQIVIIGRKIGTDENAREHCTTYGVDKENCSVAAQIGDFLKFKVMGWKETALSSPAPRVEEECCGDAAEHKGITCDMYWRDKYKGLEVEFAHRQEEHEKALAQARQEANKCQECGGQDVVCAGGVEKQLASQQSDIEARVKEAVEDMKDKLVYPPIPKHSQVTPDFMYIRGKAVAFSDFLAALPEIIRNEKDHDIQ